MRTILSITVMFAGLVSAQIPARAENALAPEVLLPAHEKTDAYRPAAAFGKDVYLVVWQADRIQKGDLVACRVSASGQALDAKPFVVSNAPDDQERPRVAFGGGMFLVVWQDLRNEKDYDTYAARISPEGRTLDDKGILIAGGEHNQSRPRVTFDGKHFYVVWEDRRSSLGYEVYGARVAPEGTILDKGGVLLAGFEKEKDKRSFDRYMPAAASSGDGRTFVVWCGTKYWVGWGTQAGSLFVKDGKVEKHNEKLEGIKDRNGSVGGGGRGGTPVSAAAGKDGYLVLWRNHRPAGRAGGGAGSNCALFVANETGWNKGETLNLSGKPHVAMDPEAAWDGSGFIAAWTEQREVKRGYGTHEVVVAARTDSKGVSASGPLEVSGTFEAPANRVAVASDGKGSGLIAYEKHPAAADVPIRIGFRILK
ncbi:hypothetical protein ACFL01_00230 [Planctomycetota bacterium]